MAATVPASPDTRLRRKQTADALVAAGFPIAPATLAKRACLGGGPPYQKFGKHVVYRWGDVLNWAEGQLTAPRRNTSEADAIAA